MSRRSTTCQARDPMVKKDLSAVISKKSSLKSRILSFIALTFLIVIFIAFAVNMAQPMVKLTINIDGSFIDWMPVFSDSDNFIYDTVGVSDPDYSNPYSASRDVKQCAVTWDNTYLYLYEKRVAAATSAWTQWYFFDLDGDGTLTATDKVLVINVNGEAYQASASYLEYYTPASAGGDPVTGDGVCEPGTPGTTIGYGGAPKSPILDFDCRVTGLESEVKIAWSELGIAAGSPIALHFSCGKGFKYSDEHCEDNAGPFSSLYHSVDIRPDNYGSGQADTTVTYTHVITNNGNATDTIDLTVFSPHSWPVTFYDASGTVISSVTLVRDRSTTITVKVHIPAGTSAGTQDDTEIKATVSGGDPYDPEDYDTAYDYTKCGSMAIIPDNASYASTGTVVPYRHTVYNNTDSTLTVNLTASTNHTWTATVFDVTGNTTITTVTAGPNSSVGIVLKVSVPTTATAGTIDQATVRGVAYQGSNTYVDSARDLTTVWPRLQIWPDNSGSHGPGRFLTYNHSLAWSWNTTATINLSSASSQGWTVYIYDSGGINTTSAVTMGPFSTADIVVRVLIPSSATSGTVDNTTITATWSESSTVRDTALDRSTVVRLMTFSDSGLTHPETVFRLGDAVYAQGFFLTTESYYYFKWFDPTHEVTTSPGQMALDSAADHHYHLLATDQIGEWTVYLMNTDGVTTLAASKFTVTFDGVITKLIATNADAAGQLIYVDSAVRNNSAATITASSINYYIWWDTNGDEVFDAGDLYILPTGDSTTYSGSGLTTTHNTTGVTVGPDGTWDDPQNGGQGWSISNEQFPYQGNYKVTATWKTSAGVFIDEKTSTFYSVPTLGFPLLVLLGGGGVYLLYRKRNGFKIKIATGDAG